MESKSTFGEVLTGLIAEKNLTSTEFASHIGVTSATVSTWQSNEHGIELSNLVAICKFFDCSLDYLAGKTNNDIKPRNFIVKNFGKRIREVMQAKSITTYRFRKETKFGSRQYYWDKGADPKLNTLIELAKYFGCTLDELVGFE